MCFGLGIFLLSFESFVFRDLVIATPRNSRQTVHPLTIKQSVSNAPENSAQIYGHDHLQVSPKECTFVDIVFTCIIVRSFCERIPYDYGHVGSQSNSVISFHKPQIVEA